jgi:LysM domain.
MRIRSFILLALAGVALLLAGGCDRGNDATMPAEADEPTFRQGQQLVRQGRNQEALNAFLKVIAKRGDAAPESHLEAGLLYLQQVKDPVAAIYHFRKYLELQPNSRQAVLVKQRIDAATREFARTLPAQPLESRADRMGELELISRLQRENEQLRAELANLRANPPVLTQSRIALGAGAPATAPTSGTDVAASFYPPANEEDSPVSLAPVDEPASNPGRFVSTEPTRPAQPPATSGRRHVVVKGDTLFSLAQKYYGNRSRWRDIYAANRNVLPNENALRLGMELRIP